MIFLLLDICSTDLIQTSVSEPCNVPVVEGTGNILWIVQSNQDYRKLSTVLKLSHEHENDEKEVNGFLLKVWLYCVLVVKLLVASVQLVSSWNEP